MANKLIDAIEAFMRDEYALPLDRPAGAAPIVDLSSLADGLHMVGVGLQFAGCTHTRTVDLDPGGTEGGRNFMRAMRSIVDEHRDACSC